MELIKTVLVTAWGITKQLPIWWLVGFVGVIIGSSVATIVTFDICGCNL